MSAADDLEKFVEWCKSRGYEFDALEITAPPGLDEDCGDKKMDLKDCGNGVFTAKDFRTEDVMISIPEREMITAGMVVELPAYSEILAKSSELLKPMEILTLFFCLETPGESHWTPYLRVLPKTFDTPAFQGVEFEKGSLPRLTATYWDTQKKELQDMSQKLMDLCPEIDYQRFLWAWHVVNTRCIFVENAEHPKVDNSDGDTIAVIPFVDMLNHHPTKAQGIALHEKVSGRYVVRASRSVAEGSQLYVCYGPHDNPRLLMEYGFTCEDNPNGKVLIEKDVLFTLAKIAGVPVTREHEKVVDEVGLSSNLYATDEGPSWAMRNNMRILLFSHEQMANSRWKTIIYSHDPIPDEVEEVIDAKLKVMLTELRDGIVAKSKKVGADVLWMWNEQIALCDVALKSFDKKDDENDTES